MARPKKVLRAYRKRENLTAEAAAAKVGIAASTWRSYENGNREVDGDTAVHFEKTIGVAREEIRPDLFRRLAA